MKIDGISQVATPSPVDIVPARVPGEGLVGAKSPKEDWTSFHSDTTSVQSLGTQALNSPEVRQGTVDALRESVNSGQYHLDPGNIATAISTGNR